MKHPSSIHQASIKHPSGIHQASIELPSPRSEYGGIDVIGDHPLDEHDDQDQDDRRDFEPAEVWHEWADRRQQRLGDPVLVLRLSRHQLVARSYYIVRDHPSHITELTPPTYYATVS